MTVEPLDDEPDDSEIEDEKPNENLKRKWIEREYFGKKTVECPSCGKIVPAEGMKCLFCGAQIFHDSGVLGKILKWVKGIFKG